ncbi:MAG: hypothetical protein GY801_25335 [bacterium]|nr:hypothetical protein [bacterium]
MITILGLLAIISMISLAVWFQRKDTRQQALLMETLAKKYQGTFQKNLLAYPKLWFNHHDYNVTVFCTGSGTGGRKMPACTHVTTSFQLPASVKLSLKSRVFSNTLSSQTDYAQFDKIFNVKGHNRIFRQKFFTPRVQEALLIFRTCTVCELNIRDDSFELTVSGVPIHVEEYECIIRSALECLDQLDTVYETEAENEKKGIQKDRWLRQTPSHALKGFLGFFLFNAGISTAYSLFLVYSIVPRYPNLPLKEEIVGFAFGGAFFPIIPTVLGSYGLWKFRGWGWGISQLLNTIYIYFYALLLFFMKRSGMLNQHVAMSIIPIYFMLFFLVFALYLWKCSKCFRNE